MSFVKSRLRGVALFLVVIELRVRFVDKVGQALANALVVVYKAAEVKTHTSLALSADRGLNLMIGLVQRLRTGVLVATSLCVAL